MRIIFNKTVDYEIRPTEYKTIIKRQERDRAIEKEENGEKPGFDGLISPKKGKILTTLLRKLKFF